MYIPVPWYIYSYQPCKKEHDLIFFLLYMKCGTPNSNPASGFLFIIVFPLYKVKTWLPLSLTYFLICSVLCMAATFFTLPDRCPTWTFFWVRPQAGSGCHPLFLTRSRMLLSHLPALLPAAPGVSKPHPSCLDGKARAPARSTKVLLGPQPPHPSPLLPTPPQ